VERPDVAGEAFNFAAERACSVLELVETILRLSDRRDMSARVLNEERGGASFPGLSSQKARERLGWSARYSLEQGLGETLRWYAERRETMTQGEGARRGESP
jgi:nucleoside-diphosphate-sugar epimerase